MVMVSEFAEINFNMAFSLALINTNAERLKMPKATADSSSPVPGNYCIMIKVWRLVNSVGK